jgi:hypothetical protein
MLKRVFILTVCIAISSCTGQQVPSDNINKAEILSIEQDTILNIIPVHDPSSNVKKAEILSIDEQDSILNIITVHDPSFNVKNDDISFLDNLLEVDQIINLTKDELRLLRNTIYAKYGYIFVSEYLRNHFSQFSWYTGTKNNVENELAEIDWINIRLIQRAEHNLPIIWAHTIEIKKPVYIGKADLPEYKYGWNNMKSILNGREGIYVTPYHFFDTDKMETILFFSPEPNFFEVVRPPYSSGEMPILDKDYKFHVYNIYTNEYYPLSPDSTYNYRQLYNNGDRANTVARFYTPEYTIANESYVIFIFIRKDHTMSYFYPSDNAILLNDFQGTVFENPFFMETFDNLISSLNIITKYALSLVYEDQYRHRYGKKYFIDRLNSYFDINLNEHFEKKEYSTTINAMIGIYDNGFYIYDNNKILLLDMKNMKVTSYNYMESLGTNVIQENISYELILTDNGYAFLITKEENKGIPYYRNGVIYKFKL